MFILTKRFRFEAAHQLPHHDGKCKRLHGHSWQGLIEVEGPEIFTEGPKTGMLVDFGDLSAVINELVEAKLDHYFLNESLEMESPTSEAIAQWLYKQVSEKVAEFNDRLAPVGYHVLLASVTIEETCTSAATYDARVPLFSPAELKSLRGISTRSGSRGGEV